MRGMEPEERTLLASEDQPKMIARGKRTTPVSVGCQDSFCRKFGPMERVAKVVGMCLKMTIYFGLI